MNQTDREDVEVEEPDEDDVEEAPEPAEAAGALGPVIAFLRPFYKQRGGVFTLLAAGVLAETAYNVAFPLSLKYLIDDALLQQDRTRLSRF